jgi:hypothetical protein
MRTDRELADDLARSMATAVSAVQTLVRAFEEWNAPDCEDHAAWWETIEEAVETLEAWAETAYHPRPVPARDRDEPGDLPY